MEVIDNRPPRFTVSRKRDVLVGVVVWNVVGTIASWIATGSGPVYSGVIIFQAVGNTVATLIWCHIDAAERGIKLGPGFRLLAILLGPLSLIYYLPRYHGFKPGLIALCRAFGFIVATIIFLTLVNVVLALISDRMGLFVAP
ncbi:MAG TPA: hypothetical protein VK468_05940 [Pyrinomonadaceae bacterium]|nr:hypothetical protein [Pyrinomonadaceae bacterium]